MIKINEYVYLDEKFLVITSVDRIKNRFTLENGIILHNTDVVFTGRIKDGQPILTLAQDFDKNEWRHKEL